MTLPDDLLVSLRETVALHAGDPTAALEAAFVAGQQEATRKAWEQGAWDLSGLDGPPRSSAAALDATAACRAELTEEDHAVLVGSRMRREAVSAYLAPVGFIDARALGAWKRSRDVRLFARPEPEGFHVLITGRGEYREAEGRHAELHEALRIAMVAYDAALETERRGK